MGWVWEIDRAASGDPLAGAAGQDPVRGTATPRARQMARDVNQLLCQLGATPSAVAKSLAELGLRRSARDPLESPLSSYLSAIISADPSVASVAVEHDRVTVVRTLRQRPTVTIPLPGHLQRFVQAWELGCYPELEPRMRRSRLARP